MAAPSPLASELPAADLLCLLVRPALVLHPPGQLATHRHPSRPPAGDTVGQARLARPCALAAMPQQTGALPNGAAADEAGDLEAPPAAAVVAVAAAAAASPDEPKTAKAILVELQGMGAEFRHTAAYRPE